MSNCPKCGASLNSDFGMIVCPQCQSAVFFDIDGVPQIAGTEPDQAFQPPSMDAFAGAPEVEHSVDGGSQYEQFEQITSSQESTDFSSVDYSQAEDLSEPAPVKIDLDQPVYASIPTEQPESFSTEQSFADVVSFANATDVEQTGSFFYSVLIEGIDSSEIRKQLLELITDVRFVWEPAEIMQQIVNGRLELRNLNPIKTQVLISRLQTLPVSIKWSQYAITDISN